ncbi:Serine--tRNA ligase [archaeon HR06]|nr:Serine--tRNA ligase [archaeon HR06]
MIDIKLLRENPDLIREALRKRRLNFPLDELLRLDEERRTLITEAQRLKEKRNLLDLEISKKGPDLNKKIEEAKEISKKIDELNKKILNIESKEEELLLSLPNIPDPSVPEGESEKDNVVIKYWGETRIKEVKDHIDLGLSLGIIDLDRAAKVAGARFYYLLKDLVKLNYALVNYGLDFLAKRGYTLVQPPYMLSKKAMSGAIILSDFQDSIYKIEGEDLYLIGTSEHAIAAMHMEEILDSKDLPLKYAGISPCFRKEAGTHGKDTKGIFRVHHFEKVEQFIFCKPEDSQRYHEEMLRNAEDFFQSLGIPYRVVLLCTADLGKVASKTYDIEAWFPAQKKYREVISCSNCKDYQARRLKIMYREKPHEKAKYVHTLNSTLVATERTLIAIMENYQEGNSIVIPEVLRPYMNGLDRLKYDN